VTLPDFIEFEPFNQLRRLMNAPLPNEFSAGYTVKHLTQDDLDRALEGIEGVTVEDFNDIEVLPDGTLSYKHRRVLLYIRDKWAFPQQNLPKFHVADCRKLGQMRQKGRFGRYVISTRTDGKFKMNFIYQAGREGSICDLKVCRLCLAHLSYRGYNQGSRRRDEEIYKTFALDVYFAAYPKSLIAALPLHTDDTAPLNDYDDGFREASVRYRAEHGWRCENENCGVDLSDPPNRKYLHTHHVNAQKYDDRRENHKALCIRCHAEEPMHEHLKNSPDYREFKRIYYRLHQATRRP
jgi:ribosomal protein L40E